MKSFQVTEFNAPLQEVDAPTPQPSGTQVLIKVKAAGVSKGNAGWLHGHRDIEKAENLTIFAVFGVFDERIIALFCIGSDFANIDAVSFHLLFEVKLAANHLAQEAYRFFVVDVNR